MVKTRNRKSKGGISFLGQNADASMLKTCNAELAKREFESDQLKKVNAELTTKINSLHAEKRIGDDTAKQLDRVDRNPVGGKRKSRKHKRSKKRKSRKQRKRTKKVMFRKTARGIA